MGTESGDDGFLGGLERAPGLKRLRGYVRRPSRIELREIGLRENLHLTEGEIDTFAVAVNSVLSLVDRMDELEQPVVALRHLVRDPGRVPTPSENPLNAIVRICRVDGADDGALFGMRVGVKDNIAVAGIPMTNGSRIAGYVPTGDACVIERLLDSGAVIVAKLNMDDFGSGGTGESSVLGPVRNPSDPTRSAGGSSSGSGAAVMSGAVDLALGVDQGGSARIPAAFCGAVSLKPSHGLVPSHGVTHIDHTIDAVCPVSRTVQGVATALDAIAGEDWRDPQWSRGGIPSTNAFSSLGQGIEGLKIGVVRESVESISCESEVVDGLERAKQAWTAAGADVVDVSIPLWSDAWAIELPLIAQMVWAMSQSEGQGIGHMGLVDLERSRAFALARRLEADNFAPLFKVWMLVGRYLHESYFSRYMGVAGNLRLALRTEVDAALGSCDLLATPTTPGVAPLLAEYPTTDADLLERGTTMSANTCPLNLTGHPALAVPVTTVDASLPVSVQVIGPRFADALVLRAGRVLHE
jgi:amidase